VRRKVLLIGATGVFGRRLARMLANMPGLDLILAARNEAALEQLKAELTLSATATISVQSFDRSQSGALETIRPWLVIDAAGPFQGSDYSVALAAVHGGAHYLDLADGRAFVAGFPTAVNEAALTAGVLAVAGASSTPALSHAAVRRITEGWAKIDEIIVAISPGARAPRGLSVVQAILSYAGQPVRVCRNGAWADTPGWSGARRLDMPGLGRRWGSLCETPDLDLLPASFPVRRQALFLAGMEQSIVHLGLALLSLPVRWGWVRSLRPLARSLRAVAGLLAPFGSDRGGMIVEARGELSPGRPIVARWALWAQANAGPSTPAAPAAALTRALLDDRPLPQGAVACTDLLELDQIVTELAGLPIQTRRDESLPGDACLYRRLLGLGFDTLPPAVRAVHGAGGDAVFSGRALARAGRSPIARLLRQALGLPRPGRSSVVVRLAPDARGETWTRRFGDTQFSSRLVDTSRLGVFEERFGPLRFQFRLDRAARGVAWRMIGWSVLGLPLPLAIAPKTRAHTEEAHGRYRFRVVVAHPWLGLLFAYRGVLTTPG
jgi:hypothetical protein